MKSKAPSRSGIATPSVVDENRLELLYTLEARFAKHPHRHPGIDWADVRARLETLPAKLEALRHMEASGGEPDVVAIDPDHSHYHFVDCSAESPGGRRSLCYDQAALESRKENAPEGAALEMASAMGIELLTEAQYRALQTLGSFDTKTSSWLLTPAPIRKLGGAIFGDCRYATVFIYHNGAQSYYAARGFRGLLRV